VFNLERILPAACLASALLFTCLNQGHARECTAALARTNMPGEDPALVDALSVQLQEAGYTVSELDAAHLCDPRAIAKDKFDLLVLPNASTLPAKSGRPIDNYLSQGGNIIALKTPVWQSALMRAGGGWIDREQYQREKAGRLPENVLFGFSPDGISGWQRSSDTMQNPTSHETVADGPPGGSRALRVFIPNLRGWDTFLSPKIENPFPKGHTLTVFSAKGDARTKQLSVEWMEKDGSRWIAVVPLFAEWKQYILEPKDFRFYESNPKRGGQGDCLNPENAERLTVGLISGCLGGKHEYWIGPIGTAGVNPEYDEYLAAKNVPVLDTLSPGYKFFDITNAAGLKVRRDQVLVSDGPVAMPSVMRSAQPRPRGAGFDKGSPWRWIPLLEADTKAGNWCGAPATIFVNTEGEYKGGIWASFGIGDSKWYKTPAALRMVRQIAERIRNGVFLVDGGTSFYTYFDDQEIKLGLQAINLSDHSHPGVTAQVTLVDTKTGKCAVTRQWPLDMRPGERDIVADTWKPDRWPDGGFIATAEIVENGKVIDRVAHDVHIWRPKEEKEFVTVKNGDFVLRGKRWRAHGVNYMPSSDIGIDDWEYFEYWLGARSYDPEVIERDLEHIKELGLNSVSIFILHESARDQNLLDLLRRLDKLGLKANLALRPGTPMDFLWPQMRDIIEYYRLWENDTIFAYDLAWEPMFGTHDERKRWDSAWEQWIVERYESIENAEKDWGYPVPRDQSGKVTNPSHEQTDADGDWRRMVAAYRRFLDTLLYKKYSSARRLVRSIDPNHLVSFRMAGAGDPTFRWGGRIPYDFPYLAGGVDFLGPEAYGQIGDWQRVKSGWFEFEYARCVAPGKPMVWAEVGQSVWEIGRMESPPELLHFQADYCRDFYRMLIASGADGVFFWWYPGGFRCHENSDFGIINPDGSDRPVSKAIRKQAAGFLNGPDAKPIDYWIEIDRDLHPDGVTGIYDAAKDEFWKAIDARRAPGLKTAGMGTTSAGCPLIAVGDTPCNGTNPPKYLDAAFDAVRVLDADGKWVLVKKGQTVEVRADQPVRAEVELTNLGLAELLPPSRPQVSGKVYVTAWRGSKKMVYPLPSAVPHLGSLAVSELHLAPAGLTEPTEVTITFEVKGRTPFGEKFRLTLIPTTQGD